MGGSVEVEFALGFDKKARADTRIAFDDDDRIGYFWSGFAEGRFVLFTRCGWDVFLDGVLGDGREKGQLSWWFVDVEERVAGSVIEDHFVFLYHGDGDVLEALAFEESQLIKFLPLQECEAELPEFLMLLSERFDFFRGVISESCAAKGSQSGKDGK